MWPIFKNELVSILLQRIAMGLYKRQINITDTGRNLVSYLNYIIAIDDRVRTGKPNLRLVEPKKETSLSSFSRDIVINNYTGCKVNVVSNSSDKLRIDITNK